MAAINLPEIDQNDKRDIQTGDLIDFWNEGGDVTDTKMISTIDVRPESIARYSGISLILDPYIETVGLREFVLVRDESTGNYMATDQDGDHETVVVSFRKAPEIGQNQESLEYLERHFNEVMFEAAVGKRLSFDLEYENPIFNEDMERDEFFKAGINYWQRLIFDPSFQRQVDLILQGVENGTIDRIGRIGDIEDENTMWAVSSLSDINRYLESRRERDYGASKWMGIEFAETYKEVRDEYMRLLETAIKPSR